MAAKVVLVPMPERWLQISMRLRPGCPPVFVDGAPTAEDRELARELFLALDADSRAWYSYNLPHLFADLGK
jgi:hypothetical protein